MNILFVCKGNIHRSVVAEELFKKLLKDKGVEGINVSSRGLHGFGETPPTRFPNLMFYEDDWKIAEPVLREFEVNVGGHVSTPVSEEAMRDSAIVFAMDQLVYDALAKAFPDHTGKLHIFGRGIPDPEGVGDMDKERAIIGAIDSETRRMVGKIEENGNGAIYGLE